MKISINTFGVRMAAFLAGVLVVFALSQLVQWSTAEALVVNDPVYPVSLEKNISDNKTPNPYLASEFSFTIEGTSATGTAVSETVTLTHYTNDTANAIVYLPVGTYTISEVGPGDFVEDDWTVQWSGYACSDGNGPIRSTTLEVTDDATANTCRADNQWRPEINPEPIFGCTDPLATNYNPAATDDDGTCDYDGGNGTSTGTIIIEKQTIPDGNQTSFTFNPSWSATDFTLMDGQQNNSGALATGTYSIVETLPANWTQTSVVCSDGSSIDAISLSANETVTCVFTNTYDNGGGNQCVDETGGSWADTVVSSDQGDTKADGPITNPDRTDPSDTLGVEDWVINGSTGFFSLGFGGSIVLSFDSYVPNVAGTDLTVYEATNGDTYPAETATVEVSQNGTTWFLAGTADNATVPGRTTGIDFGGTGLDWITYVRITDTTNPALHTNDADGFDLDAVFATQQVCDEPNDGGNGGNEDLYLVFGYVWHDENSNDAWEQDQPNPEDDETDLDGWTVEITNGEDTFSTTTDATGYYYFYVPAGTWTINEVVQSGWEKTYPNVNGHVVVVGGVTQSEDDSFFAMIMEYVLPTAHAAVMPTQYGPYNFGNVYGGNGGYSQGSYGGGGGNGKKIELSGGGGSSSNNDDDDDDEGPTPQVLGESTSAFPLGAPDTGKGGTSRGMQELQALALLSVRKGVKASHAA